MKVLLTGAAGFLGRRILKLLIERGWGIVPTARSEPEFVKGLPWVLGDLSEIDLDRRVPPGVDAICHVAAAVPHCNRLSDYQACVRDNVVATAKLVEFALRRGIRRFVCTSSVSVYRRPVEAVPVTESQPTNPSSPYGVSKLLAEMALAGDDVREQLVGFVLRCSSMYGPGMRELSVLPKWVAHARRGERITILGSGARSQDFVFVDDVAEAHVAALSATARPGLHLYNVGSGVETSLNDLAASIITVFAPQHAALVEHVQSESAEEDRFFLGVSRMRRELQVAPLNLVEGLQQLKLAMEG